MRKPLAQRAEAYELVDELFWLRRDSDKRLATPETAPTG